MVIPLGGYKIELEIRALISQVKDDELRKKLEEAISQIKTQSAFFITYK